MGKSHDLATLKDDGGTFKSSLVIDTGTNGVPIVDFKHANGNADQFRLQAGTPAVTNAGFSIYDLDASQTRLNIDASGRVTAPSQPHISGSPFGVAADNSYADNFATYRSRGTLSFSNSRVTVPVDGVYLIIFQTIRTRQSGRTDSSIAINGVVYCSSLTGYSSDDYGSQTNVASVSLSANDYIQFSNGDWYSNHNGSTPDNWQTASVTLIG